MVRLKKEKVILLLFLVIQLFMLLTFSFSESLWPDEALYAYKAKKILEEPASLFLNEFWLGHPPLFPVLAAIISLFVGLNTALNLSVILFSLSGSLLIFLLGKELFNKYYGLAATVLLLSNHLYWFYSERILLDVPLTVFMAASSYFLLKHSKNNGKKELILSLIFLICVIFVKFTGIIFIISYFAFLYCFYMKEFKRLITYSRLAFGISLACFAYFLLYFTGAINLKFISMLKLSNLVGNIPYLIINLKTLAYLMHPILFLFFMIGLIFMIFYKKTKHLFLISYLFFYIILTLLIGDALDRYLLPILIPGILVALFGFNECIEWAKEILNLRVKNHYVFFLIIIVAFLTSIQGIKLITAKENSYVGFKDAGEYLKLRSADKYYAGSMRAIRYYSGKEYSVYGGKLETIPDNISELQKQIKNKKIILETDVWEYTQPEYVYPMNEEKLEKLYSLGLNVSYAVYRDIQFRNSTEKYPIIIFFEN